MVESCSSACMKHLEAEKKKTLSDGVLKRDSGYNSPVTPVAGDITTSSSLLLGGAQPIRSNSSPAAVETEMQKVVHSPPNQLPSSSKNGLLKRQLSSPALDSSQSEVSHVAS